MSAAAIRKTITALVAGAIGWVTLVVNSAPSEITSSEWIVGATVLATALGVYAIPNEASATSQRPWQS